MNSFKKIALAMVAAMTLGSFVATPASAAPMTVALTVNGAAPATAGTDTGTAIQLPVPSDNSVDALDALKFVATVDAGTSVSVTTTNATIVTALSGVASPVTASSGSGTLTVSTGTGTTATFWVYTKTTAIGTVVLSNQGTTFTYYVQGTAGKINKLAVTAPTSAPASTQQLVSVLATDVFGNKVSGKSITGRVFGSFGTLETAVVTTGATLANFGVADFKLTLPASGRALVEFSLTTAADGAAAVTGFDAPALTPFVEVTVRDLAAELAAMTAAKATSDAALAAEKSAHDATKAKSASDAATAKAASDKALADALAKAASDAATAKAAADKALADAKTAHDAEKATLTTAAEKAIADMKAAVDKAVADANAVVEKVKADAVAAKAASDKALADTIALEKAASAKAIADAIVAEKAASAKALADVKSASDKALADAIATEKASAKAALDAEKALASKALADLKKAFNALAVKWNKANPKAKVALIK